VKNGLSRLTGATRHFAARFLVGTRGNVAMMFALALPALLMMTLGAIDIHQASKVRANLQDALDAAALAAARSNAADDQTITDVGMAALKANMPGYFIDGNGDTATFVLRNKVVLADAKVNVKVLVANIVLPPYGKLLDDYLPVSTQSQVDRSSRNVEVGLVLDITGSMDNCKKNCPSQSKLDLLKAAAKQLVTIVVQTDQTYFYSRMAIIPYSTSVNMGTTKDGYVVGARGAALPAMPVTGAVWATGASKSIGSITRASTAVITSNGHGFQNGEFVWISGISANSGSPRLSALNNRAYRVTGRSTDKFSLESFNGSSWSIVSTSGYSSSYSGGTVQKCLLSDCAIIITSPNHGMTAFSTDTAAGDKQRPSTVYIAGVEGLTQANGSFEIANVKTDSFSISKSGGSGVYKAGTGQAWCGQNGCEWRIFRKGSSSSLTSLQISDCVTERIGSSADTNASPSNHVGRKYEVSDCPASVIQPLTSNRKTLTDLINGLRAEGGTAGQIGLAWGWYTVSDTFNSLWPTYFAGPKNAAETIKSVILMTDGEFNVAYCSGVTAGDIDCNATNGNPFAQATALCTKMKADGVIVYTVGFQMGSDKNAAAILQSCASGPGRAYLPETGDDLSKNFAEIGQDITRLRISR
jgi:Flp pilus assembly protein TadG